MQQLNQSISAHYSSVALQPKPYWSLVPEYTAQIAIMIAWPHANTLWKNKLEEARITFADIIAAISLASTPWVLIPSEYSIHEVESYVNSSLMKNNRALKFPIEYSICDYDDTWIRDYGPLTTSKIDSYGKMQLCLKNFIFNGWGQKYKFDLDNNVNSSLWNSGEFHLHYLSKIHDIQSQPISLNKTPCILEGGSIDSNGDILITTKNCLLNSNRNAHLSQKEIEDILHSELGINHIIWLNHGHLDGDDTDSHVDTLARFINQDTIVFQGCNEETDSHFFSLQAMKIELISAAQEFNLQLIELPFPKPCFDETGRRLPATYANFLIVNSHLLLPTYNCDADTIAQETLQKHFPDLKIIPVPCLTLIKNNGSLHCSTMQLPQIWNSL